MVGCKTVSPHFLGPEETTIFEKFVEHVRVPYPLVCLLLALVPGYASSNFGESTIGWILWTTLAFYMFYVIRYMRLKVLRAESELLPLCPDGEETFHRAFGRIAQRKSQVFFWLLVGSLNILYFFRLFRFTGYVYLSLTVANLSLFAVAWGTVFWVYMSSIYGLHVLGQQPLKLKAYSDDTMLGVSPIGYLSLHLAIVYLSVIALGAVATSLYADLFTITSLITFVIIGGALFFLPLTSVHQLMLRARLRERSLLRSQFNQLVTRPENQAPSSAETTLSDLHVLLSDLKGLMALEIVERKALSMPTWPFDSRVLGQLTLMIVSATATIIAQIILLALKI
jgi:hypothetical protein